MEGDDLELAADLIRLKGVANELLTSARKQPTGMHAQDASTREVVALQLDALSRIIARRLESSPELGAEFGALVPQSIAGQPAG